MNERFRTIALALRPYVSDVYGLIEATDAVIEQDHTIVQNRLPITAPDGSATWNWTTSRWDYNHDSLVNIAVKEYAVTDALREGKKINAIKALREVSGCGLKEAKDAIEDPRVDRYYNSGL